MKVPFSEKIGYALGDTHLICEAVSDTLEGPYVYRGPILEPQVGWTTHQCVTESDGTRSLLHQEHGQAGVRNRHGGGM